MKKLAILLSAILLSGCVAVPAKQTFPAIPDSFKVPCADLEIVPNDVVLSDLMVTVTNNYGAYHLCSDKNTQWYDWYVKQKAIFDKVNRN